MTAGMTMSENQAADKGGTMVMRCDDPPSKVCPKLFFCNQLSLVVNKYSWVPNKRLYLFIWHQRNMKKETDTKTDKSI